MKKILSVAIATLMLVGSVFAIDFSVDGNFAVPLDFTKSETHSSSSILGVTTNYDRTTNNKEFGLGGDLGLKAMLTKTFGVKVDLGLYFPQSVTSKTTTVTKVGSSTTTSNPDPTETKYSDIYDSYTSFNLFVGPAIRLANKKAYAFCVTPGFSVDWRTAKYTVGDTPKTSKTTTLGFGAELDARFNITSHFYLNAACPFVFQFKTIYDDDSEADAKGFYMVPKIGVGYRF